MKISDYCEIAFKSFCPPFWVVIIFYIMFMISEERREHLLDAPFEIMIVLLVLGIFFTLLQVICVAFITKSTFHILSKFKITLVKQFLICGLLLTYWFLPFTIPGQIFVIVEHGIFSKDSILNILGRIIAGGIFFLIPTVSYLFMLKKRFISNGA